MKKNVLLCSLLALLLSQVHPIQAANREKDTSVPSQSPCDCQSCANDPSKTATSLPSLGTTVTEEQTCPENDKYFQGYIQALIDMNYYEYRVSVTVQDRVVYLYNLPKNATLCSSIIYFVQNIPGVDCVKLECPPKTENPACEDEQAQLYPPGRVSGIWLPQQTVLFAPLLADPRQTCYSAAYRFGDDVCGKRSGATSFGEDFPIYRWRNVGTRSASVQIGIEGCVFSVFDLTHTTTVLINSDFFVSIPVTYAYDAWSYRFRIYHISSHLGDEYLVDNPETPRYNLSFEAVDAFVSYWPHTWLRIYGGAGFVIHYDPSFPLQRSYVQYGAEFRFLGRRDFCNSLYMQPYLAFNNVNAAYVNWNNNFTAALGLEWSKIQGVGRKVRISCEYHDGYSVEGQFCRFKTRYTQFKLAYGF